MDSEIENRIRLLRCKLDVQICKDNQHNTAYKSKPRSQSTSQQAKITLSVNKSTSQNYALSQQVNKSKLRSQSTSQQVKITLSVNKSIRHILHLKVEKKNLNLFFFRQVNKSIRHISHLTNFYLLRS
jgi:hypothetical protein